LKSPIAMKTGDDLPVDFEMSVANVPLPYPSSTLIVLPRELATTISD
ncbi:unnamed protein product, partial [Rotaria magnacalcarata]